MTQTLDRLEIPDALWQAMLAHLSACLPEEGCGLLGARVEGSRAQVTALLPVENALHSPVRFSMAPAALLEALSTLERDGLELAAFFHSHPAGPEFPSATDRAEFAYPGVLALIACPLAGAPGSWQARAFRIDGLLDAQAPFSEVAVARTRGDTAYPPAP